MTIHQVKIMFYSLIVVSVAKQTLGPERLQIVTHAVVPHNPRSFLFRAPSCPWRSYDQVEVICLHLQTTLSQRQLSQS